MRTAAAPGIIVSRPSRIAANTPRISTSVGRRSGSFAIMRCTRSDSAGGTRGTPAAAGGVHGLQRVADRVEDEHRLRCGQRAALDAIGQALALEQLHHEVVAAVGELAMLEHVDDVAVADLVDESRLLLEALDRRGVAT